LPACRSAGLIHGGPVERGAHFHIYDQVRQFMEHRTLLEDGQGVLWTSKAGPQVFFAFKAGKLELPSPARIQRVAADGLHVVGTSRMIAAAAREVFVISPG
jgi:hypothetical protein